MHFVVSWDIKSQGTRWTEINNAMKEGLGGYSWVNPLTLFYIVEVHYEHDWDLINNNLFSVAERFPGEVNFIMSPIHDFESDYFIYKMPDKDFYKTL
jgi:hypothetical protein